MVGLCRVRAEPDHDGGDGYRGVVTVLQLVVPGGDGTELLEPLEGPPDLVDLPRNGALPTRCLPHRHTSLPRRPLVHTNRPQCSDAPRGQGAITVATDPAAAALMLPFCHPAEVALRRFDICLMMRDDRKNVLDATARADRMPPRVPGRHYRASDRRVGGSTGAEPYGSGPASRSAAFLLRDRGSKFTAAFDVPLNRHHTRQTTRTTRSSKRP